MGVCNCSMFCCTLLYVHSSIAIILMGKRELVALLNLSSWCLVMVERLFLGVPRGCLRFVIVVFPDHTHLLFLVSEINSLQLGIDLNGTKLYLLLYADDFCCVANNEAELQAMLDTLHSWYFLISTDMSKAVHFRKGRYEKSAFIFRLVRLL